MNTKGKKSLTEAGTAGAAGAAGTAVNTAPVDAEVMKKMFTDFQDGMQIIFAGYSKVFGTLARQIEAAGVVNTSVVTADTTAATDAVDSSTNNVPAAKKKPEGKPEDMTPKKTDSVSEVKADSAEKAMETQTEPESTAATTATDATAATSAISYEDLKRVVIAKIEQKQENNLRIGELVKKYGVKNIGELDEKQREAFMTDLAAI